MTIWHHICQELSISSDRQQLGGGCINELWRCRHADGSSLIIKIAQENDLLTAEAHGLACMADASTRVPQIIAQGFRWLAMEDLGNGRPGPAYDRTLGEMLAQQHLHHGPGHGFDHTSYCGATLQNNAICDDGFHFFGEHRLLDLARRCQLPSADLMLVERLASRLPNLVPPQPLPCCMAICGKVISIAVAMAVRR